MATKVPPTYDQYTRPEAGGLDFKDSPSKTKLEFVEECDINRIMARYTQTGELPLSIMGEYGDFSEAPDYFEAQNILARADAQFSALPAEVRARFANDPAKFLEFVHDEKNLDELESMGLLSVEAARRREAARTAAAAGAAETPPPPSPAKAS